MEVTVFRWVVLNKLGRHFRIPRGPRRRRCRRARIVAIVRNGVEGEFWTPRGTRGRRDRGAFHPSGVKGDDGRVEVGNFVLTDCQIPVEDFQKLSFDPTDIALSEDAGGDRPVDVLESGIIRELADDIRVRTLCQSGTMI